MAEPSLPSHGASRTIGFAASLWRVKPMALIMQQAEDRDRSLARSMGVVSLTAFGVAAIIGAGIFVLTGVAAAKYAGPAIILSYVAAGITSGLAAHCAALRDLAGHRLGRLLPLQPPPQPGAEPGGGRDGVDLLPGKLTQ